MPGRRNWRRRKNLNRKINYSDEGKMTIVPEMNKKKTGLHWRHKDPQSFKFVDDSITLTKVNMDAAAVDKSLDGHPIKVRHDLLT